MTDIQQPAVDQLNVSSFDCLEQSLFKDLDNNFTSVLISMEVNHGAVCLDK